MSADGGRGGVVDEMRQAVSVALEQQGHEVVDPPHRYPLPPRTGLRPGAALIGELQTRGPDGRPHAFYMRPGGEEPAVPEWFSTIARAGGELDDHVAVCLVLETEEFGAEEDARACGAGVYVLRPDGSLEQVVEPMAPTDTLTADEFAVAVDRLRGEAVTIATLHQELAADEYRRVAPLAAGAGPVLQQKVREALEAHASWGTWRAQMEAEARRVLKNGGMDDLARLEAMIDAHR